MATDTPIAPMSPDWVFSNTSNVSVARDRGWFTSYTPFTSYVNEHMAVAGIGSVEIPVKRRSCKGKKHGYTIRIDEVLHVPTAVCNILGQGDFMNRYNVNFSSGITDRQGRFAASFDKRKRLFCLHLSGPPHDPITSPSLFLETGANSGSHFYINAQWSTSERARWEAFMPYTDAEKAWLKQNFGDEFHFLQQYGLSIHKDESREEGRSLLRSLMAVGDHKDDNKDEDNKDDEDNDDKNSFLDELEADPMSHVADYNFSEEQLDWIKKHYKHSGNFLLSYGLKPYDDEDCHEGVAIVEAIMSEDK